MFVIQALVERHSTLRAWRSRLVALLPLLVGELDATRVLVWAIS